MLKSPSVTAVCVGGAMAKRFQSPKGDTGALQCYARAFRWGESQQSEEIMTSIDWADIVAKAAEDVGKQPEFFDRWLAGGKQIESEIDRREAEIDDAEAALKQSKDAVAAFWKKFEEIHKHIPGVSRGAYDALKKYFEKKDDPLEQAVKSADGKVDRLNAEKGVWVGQQTFGTLQAAKFFREKWDGDVREMVAWSRTFGHTLGHETSLWKALLKSNIGIIRQFRGLTFKVNTERSMEFDPYGPNNKVKFQTKSFEKIVDPKNPPKFEVCNQNKTNALNALIQDVVKGDRAADDKWYDEFLGEATEDDMLRIQPNDLAVTLRVHHVFETFHRARRTLLRRAHDYANEVFENVQSRRHLTRLELHEEARSEPILAKFKGNVFCVSETRKPAPDGKTRFVCASSPLLVAGAVERWAERIWWKKPANEAEEQRRDEAKAKRRADVKTEWCYGGMVNRPVYGHRTSKAVLGEMRELDSPYELDVPESVTEKKKAVSTANWLKCTGFQYSDESWERALEKPTEKVAKKAAPPTEGKKKSYVQASAPRKDPQGDPISAEDRKDAEDESADLMKEAGGLLKTVLDLVMPELGEAMRLIENAAHMADKFLETWKAKLVGLAKGQWEISKAAITKSETENVTKAQSALIKQQKAALDELIRLQGEVDAAHTNYRNADPKDPKKKDKSEAYEKAKANFGTESMALKGKVQEAQAAVDTAIDKLKDFIGKERSKNRQLPKSGEIVAGMLEALTKEVTTRVNDFLEPKARAMFSKGWSHIRSVMDPLLGAAISAIGSIPFAGGALAFLAQVAYTFAMDALQESLFDALYGLVERAFAKMIRAAISPLFNAVKGKLIALVHSACAAYDVCPTKVDEVKFSALPPRDRWIERALACNPGPVIDDAIYKRAALARATLERKARDVQTHAHRYVRGFVNRALARHGYSYDAWMRESAEPTPEFLVKARSVARRVLAAATDLKRKR
ncbi:MAG: hypothetical protein HYY84_02765 [Deltaproteobacteria bacterium]|nr:hypothetical protein [Deltaproteobacteria bacterium]